MEDRIQYVQTEEPAADDIDLELLMVCLMLRIPYRY